MFTVYRFEDLHTGKGPYATPNDKLWQILSRHDRSPNHPSVWDDVSGFDRKHYCACESIDNLLKWFEPDLRRKLYAEGYAIVKYTVSDIKRGKKQVAFKKEDVVKQQIFVKGAN